jgi:hypothetical protein
MEEKLQDNDHKGVWEKCTLGYLIKRLREEVDELQAAVVDGHCDAAHAEARPRPWSEVSARRALNEAADVANFAMMLADVCRQRSKR